MLSTFNDDDKGSSCLNVQIRVVLFNFVPGDVVRIKYAMAFGSAEDYFTKFEHVLSPNNSRNINKPQLLECSPGKINLLGLLDSLIFRTENLTGLE